MVVSLSKGIPRYVTCHCDMQRLINQCIPIIRSRIPPDLERSTSSIGFTQPTKRNKEQRGSACAMIACYAEKLKNMSSDRTGPFASWKRKSLRKGKASEMTESYIQRGTFSVGMFDAFTKRLRLWEWHSPVFSLHSWQLPWIFGNRLIPG